MRIREKTRLKSKVFSLKDFEFKPLSFQFPSRDKVKCDGLGRECVLFLSLREVNTKSNPSTVS